MGRRKKSFNPFKMLGSWVGALIMVLAIIISYIEFGNVLDLLAWTLWIAIGFLFGWGIHSLFRRFNR